MRKRLWKRLLIICGALTLLAAVCLVCRSRVGRGMRWQEEAERWAGESGDGYTQLACYFGPGSEIDRDTVYTLRGKLEETFVTAGMTENVPGRLWRDCWSATGTLSVTGSRGTVEAASVAAGGSFFEFHPMELRSGSPLREDDLMKDRVVLDERLAWLLFGSTDVAGMEVTIGGLPYRIAGVTAAEADKPEQQLRGETPTVYLSAEAWDSLGGSGIDCYEIVLPEPVKGYAEGLLKDNLKADSMVTVPVTGRFRLSADWARIGKLSQSVVRTDAVRFPYWENAARLSEQRRSLWLLACTALLVIPAVCAFAALVWLILKGRKALFRNLPRLFRRIGDGLYELSARLTGKRKKKPESVKPAP